MHSTTRLTYMAAVLTRAEQDARELVIRFGNTKLGFWSVAVLVSMVGVSAISIWPFLGFPWWTVLITTGTVIAGAVSHASYSIWKEQTIALSARAGLELGGGVRSIHSSPVANANAFRITFDRTNQEARELKPGNVLSRPRAVLFEHPRSKKIIHESDLPAIIKTRVGLSRFQLTVHRFIDGGIVLDDRRAPLTGGSLVCLIYMPDDISVNPDRVSVTDADSSRVFDK